MGMPARRLVLEAPVREPIIQNVIDGSTSWGSATNFTRLTSAVKKAPTTMPARMIMRMGLPPPRTRLIASTKKTAARPLASDMS